MQRLLDAGVELPAEVQQAAAGNLVTVDLAGRGSAKKC